MNFGHGGHIQHLARRAGLPVTGILDFSANINPLGPPECLRSVVNRHLEAVVHYPDPSGADLVKALAAHHDLPPEQIVVGNGSTELFYALPRVLDVDRAVIPVPSYIDYRAAVSREGLPVETLPLDEARGFSVDWNDLAAALRKGDMVILGQPNNPTGGMVDADRLTALADRHPQAVFVVDEAFADFVADYESLIHRRRSNIVVVRSMTKFYAIPGLRLGYAMADPEIAGRLRSFLPPWSVGTLAQRVGVAVLDDAAYAEKTRSTVALLRQDLLRDLGNLPGLKVYDGAANFLLVKLRQNAMDAVQLERRLLERGIAIRICANFDGLDQSYFRVAVRTAEENRRLVAALARALRPDARPVRSSSRRTPAIMFLGTTSNAGKSVLTAAMGRILLQDGYRVAPFKAQNMSLNSYVTADGGEMGRAQVVQAQACRLAPDVRMNPVLIKPNSDMGAQVIAMGKPVGNMAVSEYITYKSRVVATVHEAYDSLAAEMDVIVLEGAGSPAEVNLKSHDIVNLSMAEHAGAMTLLVGDIDRGGVFAAFAGTLDLLSERERSLIAGFVINRFRGKEELLGDAIDRIAAHTGRPTYGVVPYVPDLGLPEEDSVSFKDGATLRERPASDAAVEIAVVDLPHISNFTDLDALMLEPDVRVRIVKRVADLERPDALILPGSKNTIDDLDHLQRQGLTDAILELVRQGTTEVVGVCGGFQMLCRTIDDPGAVESAKSSIQGLGLLDAATTMAAEKALRQVCGRHRASGLSVKGYEIHHGHTRSNDMAPAVVRDDGEVIGLASADGQIWGTYLHGIFDDDGFRRWFVDRLRQRRGWAPVNRILATFDVDAALDRLADVVRAHLDIASIYRQAGLR